MMKTGYTGISTREVRLTELLEAVIANHCSSNSFCSTCAPAREFLDAKCGIHVCLNSEILSRGGVRIGQTYPCKLPAGHSGQCNAEE